MQLDGAEEVTRILQLGAVEWGVAGGADREATYAHARPACICTSSTCYMAHATRLLRTALCILKLLDSPGAAFGINEVLDRLSRTAVRRRYRELSVAVHPDKCSHAQAKEVGVGEGACVNPLR